MAGNSQSGFGAVVEWLAILAIAFYVVPLLMQTLFSGFSGVGVAADARAIRNDPFAAADAVLSADLLRMSMPAARAAGVQEL